MPLPPIADEQYTGMEPFYRRPDGHIEIYRGYVEGYDTLIKIAAEPTVVDSLHREARALAKLQDSPHAPPLYRLGYNEETEKTFLAMGFIEGENLKQFIALDDWTCPAFPPESATEFLRRIAEAEHNIIERGVLYRDYNPEHIIIKPDKTITFIDFGAAIPEHSEIAKEWQNYDNGWHNATWEFMAPEEFTPNDTLTEAIVTYRLGVMYHLLLTGSLPAPRFYNGEEAQQWAQNPQFEFNRLLTDQGETFFQKVLAPSPTNRPMSIGDFLAEIPTPKQLVRSVPA